MELKTWFRQVVGGGMMLQMALCAIAGEPASAKAQRQAVKPFAVYDANGKFVGPFYPPSYAQIAIGSKRYAVELWSQAGLGTDLQLLPSVMYFTTADCSGAVYVVVAEHPSANMPRAFTEVVGGKVLVYPAIGQTTIQIRSARNGGFCIDLSGGVAQVYSVDEPSDITDLYSGKFRVR